MSSLPLKPANLPENLVWYYIIGNYVIYLFGAQYVFAPLLAAILTCYLIAKWWHQVPTTPEEERIKISPLMWSWIIGMIVMEFALIVGHVNSNLDLVQMFKSSLYWYKHWALLALFPLIGHLDIRPKLIYRAVCILCLQCLIVILLNGVALILPIPNLVYTSPLQALGGDSMFYNIKLFAIEPSYGESLRIQLFAPWSPALGLIANMFFWLTCQEGDRKWRYIGMASSVVMIVLTVSRTAILCLPTVWFLTWISFNFMRPGIQFGMCLISLVMGIISPTIITGIEMIKQEFHAFRPGSSRVRAALRRMTLERWRTEGLIWGRGINTSRGPASLGFMPIGTHHTWYGVLYLHGIVGFLALTIPFIWTLVSLLVKAKNSPVTQLGFKIILILLIYSFTDNIETIAYLYWPGLLFLGIAIKNKTTKDRNYNQFSSASIADTILVSHR